MPDKITTIPFSKLVQHDKDLLSAAFKASARAYAPYSRFAVGCAVRARSGRVYAGANFENASYGLSTCAEVSALAAVHTAQDFPIETLAVVGHSFAADSEQSVVVTPCGRCRQLIFEAAQLSAQDIRILAADGSLDRVAIIHVSDLLPMAFDPKNIDLQNTWPRLKDKLEQRVAESLVRLTGAGIDPESQTNKSVAANYKTLAKARLSKKRSR
jgi:cytidine deaminase